MRINYEINTIECKLTLGRNLLWGSKSALGRQMLLWGEICSGEANVALGRQMLLWGEFALGRQMLL